MKALPFLWAILLVLAWSVVHALDPNVEADVAAQSASVSAVVNSLGTRFKGQAYDRLAGLCL